MTPGDDDEMVHITGNDDFGWSWKRVNADGVTVAEGKCSLAEEAVRAASELAKRPQPRPRRQGLGR